MSKEELQIFLREAWRAVPEADLQTKQKSLVMSAQAVLKNNSSRTKYFYMELYKLFFPLSG